MLMIFQPSLGVVDSSHLLRLNYQLDGADALMVKTDSQITHGKKIGAGISCFSPAS